MSAGWNTIESDAGVFTSLIEALGVKNVQFEELLTLDASYLLSLGQPIYGVIFLFKYPTNNSGNNNPTAGSAAAATTTASSSGIAAAPPDGNFDEAAGERLFFAHQVINNACATQALLSLLLNQPSLTLGDELASFRDFTITFPPGLRGEALSNSELIRGVHNSFARASPFVDEVARSAADDDAEDVFHFIAYTRVDGTLYELDGLQPAPIAHGACANELEFAERIIAVLQRRIQRYGDGEIRFNLIAAVPDPRIDARARGDWETLEREERKRRDWAWENALRRHNFLAFTAEILKTTVKQRLDAGNYDDWLDAAKKETQRKLDLRRRARGGQGDMEIDS